ncbi:MAG: cyclic nucleotide-binding domain-containing protein [Gaiellales bacterium]
MLRKGGKIELLKSVALFAGCSKKELSDIALIADELEFPAGTVLIVEGERGKQLFVLVEGSVDVAQGGKKIPTRGGTEVYGEISLLSGSPATATVTTTTPARALVIAPRDFKALLERAPSIQLRVLQSLSERLAPHVI